MGYNPYDDVLGIYKAGVNWQNEKDDSKRKAIQQQAQTYYNNLTANNYSGLADTLRQSDSAKRKKYVDAYKTSGMTKTRDYLYSLGQSKGMSQSDVDKLIGWDNLTGEVTFGGKNIGKPDEALNGTSYWKDTSKLDNAFNDYISRSGTVRSKSTAVNQENENLFQKYNREYEDLKSTNPFETDEAKSILGKYDLAGLQGRDNAVATNAGSNGGNIDSFAAANALRQQSSLINQGQQAVLEDYQQKLDRARSLLSDMGVNIDRVYNQDETSKNNDVARKSEIASVTGIAPDEWVASNNPYIGDDGKIKDEYKDVDFAAVMAKAKAAGNTNAYNAAAAARYYKIMGDYGAYGKYDDGNYITPGQQKTESAREFDEQIAAADRALNVEADMNSANNQNKLDQITTSANYGTTFNDSGKVAANKPTLTASQAASAVKNGETSQAVIDAYNYYGTDYTADNLPKVGEESTGGTDPLISDDNSAGKNGWDNFMQYFPEDNNDKDRKKIRAFLTEQLKPYYDNGWEINEEVLEKLIVGSDVKKSNSTKYDIDIDEAKSICNALGLESEWLDKYKNRWGFNSGKGMKSKS